MSRVAPLPQTDPALDADAAPVSPPVVRGRGALRVAFCIDNMNVGGTELNALRTAPHLQAAGVELSVFTTATDGPLLERYAELGVSVDQLPVRNLYGPSALAAGRRMARLIRSRGVEIVHAHDSYSNIIAAPWSRLAGAAFLASRRWWEGPDRAAQRWANRTSYLFAHRILANSESVADLLVRRERVRRSRIVVVPNFLDEEAFEAAPPGWRERMTAKLELPERCRVIGCVAALSEVKDHATLLRALAPLLGESPDLYLLLVGRDAGSQGDLKRLAEGLGVTKQVRFAGAFPNQPSAHHLFDVSVLSSKSEGMPNSLLEAMACGRPVVATAVGAISDAVREGETGYLVPPGDSEQLRDRIGRLLRDPGLARRLGSSGRERARQDYSAPRAMERLLATYRNLVRRPDDGAAG